MFFEGLLCYKKKSHHSKLGCTYRFSVVLIFLVFTIFCLQRKESIVCTCQAAFCINLGFHISTCRELIVNCKRFCSPSKGSLLGKWFQTE